ncbi:sal-like protein 2 [Carassius carassius]|uniref:sal-like protein 2 n=1 Tax=Carassius carassius TaxID=217509 RepID=UPI002868DC9E|nr:sal-like protein 2 [Carassius carassius]
MSRRKQKRPQHFFSPILNTSWLLQHEEQLAVKSLTSTLAKNSSCSSSQSTTQSHQSSSNPSTPVERLTTPSLPRASHPVFHIPSQPIQFTLDLKESHLFQISDIPSHSTNQCITTTAPTVLSTHNHTHLPMASPKLGVSATTTSCSSSSAAASLCVPPHPGSPSSVPQGPPSPVTPSSSPSTVPSAPACAPVSIAFILEELRVLQQRQIHQMQMTEEICRQVLRLGGGSCEVDSKPFTLPSLPQLCLKGSVNYPRPSRPKSSPPPTSVAPLLACFSSLLPPQPTSKSSKHTHPLLNVLRPHKAQYDSGIVTPASFTSHTSASTSSSISTAVASNYPLTLSLGLPSQKSSTTGASGHSGLTFPNQSIPAASVPSAPSQDPKLSAQGGTTVSMSGRMQHACRFCRKLFSSDSSLQIHLRSHTGERPYQCPVCFSRFTTRGNLKVHFLRHREQNPELSFSLFPCSLFASVTGGSMGGSAQMQPNAQITSTNTNATQRHQKQQEDDLRGNNLEGSTASTRATTSSLPPSIDLALLTTAHSLLQLNRAAAAAAAAASTSTTSSITSSSSSSLASTLLSAPASSTSSIAGVYKGVKRFDENTPPIPTLLPHSAYSQLANLPKIFFPTSSAQHHAGHGFLRPTTPAGSFLPSPQKHITFPFTASSTTPSISTPTSDTSKLQRLVEKLEKEPQSQSHWVSSIGETSTSSHTIAEALSYSSSGLMSTSTSVVTSLPSSTIQIPSSLFSKASPYLGLMHSAGTLAPNQCSVCLRVLSCPRALRLHQATHLGERPFPCKLCGRSFSTKGSLRAHLATHRARPPNSRAQNSCPLCQRKFTNALVLQHHIRMHLGGQLPPEQMPDTSTECDIFSHSESMEFSASEMSPSATDVQLLNDLQSITDCRHTESLAVSTALTACAITSSLPASLSSGPIPPLDLSPDPSLNPTPYSPPTIRADPPELSLSVPSPVDSAPSLVPLATQSVLATTGPDATDELSFEHSSNTAFLEEKKISSSPALKKESPQRNDSEHCENRSVSPIPCSGSKSNLEDLLSIQAHNASRVPLTHPQSTPPSLLALRSESASSYTVHLEEPDQSILQKSKLIPQEFSKEEKTEDNIHKTPKNGQRTTPDMSINAEMVSDTVKKTNEDETEDRDTNMQKTIKEAHCSSTSKDKADTIATEMDRTDSTVCISLTPSLPPPMPEKKIYHCSECGKEYASRSGLKGHMKHHGGFVKAPRALAKTKGPERVLHHERSQTHHLPTFLPPGHQ